MEVFKDIKAVLADWDDTHITTFYTVVDIVNQFAKHRMLPQPGIDRISAQWGKPTALMIACLWSEVDPKAIYEQYTAFDSSKPDTLPFPGIEEAVLNLIGNGFKVGIVSSSSSISIRQYLDRYLPLIKDCYTFIHGKEDCLFHKPDPRVFDPAIQILNRSRIKESQILYVGDSLIDYFAAKNRGLSFVATVSGCSSREVFLKEGLDEAFIINRFTDLPRLLTG